MRSEPKIGLSGNPFEISSRAPSRESPSGSIHCEASPGKDAQVISSSSSSLTFNFPLLDCNQGVEGGASLLSRPSGVSGAGVHNSGLSFLSSCRVGGLQSCVSSIPTFSNSLPGIDCTLVVAEPQNCSTGGAVLALNPLAVDVSGVGESQVNLVTNLLKLRVTDFDSSNFSFNHAFLVNGLGGARFSLV